LVERRIQGYAIRAFPPCEHFTIKGIAAFLAARKPDPLEAPPTKRAKKTTRLTVLQSVSATKTRSRKEKVENIT